MRYVGLLRGINVGGNTMLKMSELKPALEAAGLSDVVTYINSGNIAFDSPGKSESKLVDRIESAIKDAFDKEVPVMVRDRRDITRIIEANPFAGEFDSHKEMHVLFLKEEMPDEKVDQLLAAATGPERYQVAGREIYCHLPNGVIDSLMGKNFIEKKLKVSATGRNWRTIERLATL